MIAMDPVVGAIFSQRLIKHDGCELIKRVRADVSVKGGREGAFWIPKVRKGRKKRGGTEDQNDPILSQCLSGSDQMLHSSQVHSAEVGKESPTNGEQDLSVSES